MSEWIIRATAITLVLLPGVTLAALIVNRLPPSLGEPVASVVFMYSSLECLLLTDDSLVVRILSGRRGGQ